MNNLNKLPVLEALVQALDIPNSAYETATNRYKDLGDWLHESDKSQSARHDPRVLPQGSFRLGTVIRPLHREDYDLDLACILQNGMTTADTPQRQLKQLLGQDLRAYQQERRIQENPEEKQRCWRLNYQDELSFHMDIVPGIPQERTVREALLHRMAETGTSRLQASGIANHAVAITDTTHPRYGVIAHDWETSNPEGYALWFESRMRQAQALLSLRAMNESVLSIDELPTYKWKTPLQQVIQILKRHRDVMFEKNPDGKPISIIITTLAARAYQGEADLPTALTNILATMGSLINPTHPRVPNPVNPAEDFADKWATSQGRALRLEQNLHEWILQAAADLQILTSSQNGEFIVQQALQKFGTRLNEDLLPEIVRPTPGAERTPRTTIITNPLKPWGQ